MAGGPIQLGQVSKKHREFLHGLHVSVDNTLRLTGEAAQREVKNGTYFKRRTNAPGSLKDATRFALLKVGRTRRLRVYSAKKTAHFLEWGTRAHEIVARRKKFLRFKTAEGKVVYRRRVWHPGTDQTQFLRTACVLAGDLMSARMTDAGIQRARLF